jgi:hypothetical protein
MGKGDGMHRLLFVCVFAAAVAGCQNAQGPQAGSDCNGTCVVGPGPEYEGSLQAPEAIRTEHKHLHEQLAAARAMGGRTGEAADNVARVLRPHFEEEDAYAMPPLGLLPAISRGEVTEDMRPAVEMSHKLQANYDKMLAEHEEIVAALRELEAAAQSEGHSDTADFARSVILHARNEEQVLYPTTLLIGRYIESQLGRK